MIAVDTNVVVRYLTGDHLKQAAKAKLIIDNQQVYVPTTVLLETEWVLRSVYGFSAAEVCRALRRFAGLATVSLEHSEGIALALDRAEAGMDFADALHLGAASHCESIMTFDRKFVKAAQAAGTSTVQEA